MAVTGIICEYNPFHRGHGKQISLMKAADPESTVVCLMSGSWVQRGQPAIFSPLTRAKAALLAGVDLVLELPVTVSLSSAEGFARGGVEILTKLGAERLCFGAETAEPEKLTRAAEALLHPDFSLILRQELDRGLSFPVARSRAAQAMGADPETLTRPNDILATEYIKAILEGRYQMEPVPILRAGDYHDLRADRENPSATALRRLILAGEPWLDYVPEEARPAFAGAVPHHLSFGERAILAKLRSMEDEEFERLPYGSEGLWRKLMHESRRQNTLEEILTAVKSKRYTRSRLDRMVMCAFLGLTGEMMAEPAPYVRVLAMSSRGRALLRTRNKEGFFVNLGKTMEGDYARLEQRLTRLYGLFAREPELESPRQRVVLAEET